MEIGDIVDGRYRLLELLGEGAAGKVFRADDLGANNRFIALKLLHAKDPRWEDFFRREFEVLSYLHHPNLVRVYDFGTAPEDSTYYFTQELVVGKPLLDVVLGKKIDEVAQLFIEICRALEFIHGHGVLHRDLKPANILVQSHADPGERVRVLDFGLWRELDPTPQKGARWAGTPPYLASEVLRGYGHSISADLYAVGVTLFQGVTRKLPHGRGTPQELLQARKEPAPDLHGIVADPLANLIEKLLFEEIEGRPASAAEVAAALSELVPESATIMPVTLGRAKVVGRDATRETLSEIFSEVKNGASDTRMVTIVGPDGIGKSRFAQEFKAFVQLNNGRSAIGRCTEDLRWSFQPITEMLRVLVPSTDRSDLSMRDIEVLERLRPELAKLEDNEFSASRTHVQESFQNSVVNLFIRLSHDLPIVLVLEDVTHVDSASLAVLCDLLTHAEASKILVIVTAVNVEEGLPVELQQATKNRNRVIELTPLENEDTRRLIGALLGQSAQDVPDTLLDTVVAHAKGNPLMVEELVAFLIERGDLERGPDGWLLDSFQPPLGVPAPVDVLAERLHRLSEIEQCTMCALAVFNRPAGPRLLSMISGLSVAEARQALTSTESAGLIRVVGAEGGRPRVIFRHPQIRDALIRELADGNVLQEWHQNCAEVLEEGVRKRGNVISDTLAYHYEAAGDEAKALEWLMKAAEYSNRTFAFENAMDLSKKASRLIERGSVAQALRLQNDLIRARAMMFSGRITEAKSFLDATIRHVAKIEAPAMLAELHLWFGRACNLMGETEKGQRAVERTLRMISVEEHPVAAAWLYLARAELTQFQIPANALKDAMEARRLFKGRKTTVSAKLSVYQVLTGAAASDGNYARSIEYARNMATTADKHRRSLEKVTALRHLVSGLSIMGARLEARTHLNQALKLAREVGFRVEEAILTRILGDQLYISGAYGEAMTRFQQAATLSAEMGQKTDRADAIRSLALCHVSKGEYQKAMSLLDSIIPVYERARYFAPIISSRSIQLNALIAMEQLDEAQKILDESKEHLPEAGINNTRAQFYIAEGNLHSARSLFDDARRCFLSGAATARLTGDKMLLGDALVGYGQLLLRFDAPARASRMAKRAERCFSDLDAQGQLRRLKPLVNASEGLAKAD
jgi:serine/threonine protein kinase/tetratricopeptide (TPR) repeat protein